MKRGQAHFAEPSFLDSAVAEKWANDAELVAHRRDPRRGG